MTQRDKILCTLERGHSITPIDALRAFGCFRLGARIWELKKRGHKIERRMVTDGKARYAEYYIPYARSNEGLTR